MIIRSKVEEFKQIEGHPYLLQCVDTSVSDDFVIVSVLNVINRICYYVAKSEKKSYLLGSKHIEFGRKGEFGKEITEAESLKDLIDKMGAGIVPEFTISTIDEYTSDMDYICDGKIEYACNAIIDGFDRLKELTTDKEIIEVLEAIMKN